ncbi:hypothetical protein A2576_04000 [Candidatus Amesbacteria bacterium RIFOXYD1_FULL_47_9]|uniref:Glycosyltransferase 2-like domain-containing protein n=1 Tax=Candidatus Amesbacteria bacterium RIFOXYD1_FULL_47_9 TaxID=1797267 RepID=A0A1F5A446_9BACT|nr:MAG: hypothetical protein A2576_04000 [Candidatus Amesbacteria bacterium RIFOXYD1_FULL_47_9]
MLSVAVIAKDTAQTLPECLNSAKNLSDDIVVVVDAATIDATAQIAFDFGAKVYIREFDNFSAQKNFALSKCRYRWVLALDADETVSSRLAAEIKTVLPGTKNAAFSIPRLNYIFGKPVYHTNWSPETDRHVWLFDKSRARWSSQVHELVEVDGPVGRLNSPKTHINYQSVGQFISKMNQYTSLEVNSGKFSWTSYIIRPVWLRILFQPVWKFLRHYVLFMGFLDGWHGLFLSYLMAVYGLALSVKAWEKTRHRF